MTKTELFNQLKTARAEWDALIGTIDPKWMAETGVEGPRSAKDIIAHVIWYEREMVGMLNARALVGSDLWELPQDERNAVLLEENRNRSLDDVLTESKQVFEQLLLAVQALSEQAVNDPSRFKDMPTQWVPWQVIAGNTFDHYPVHAASIRMWLANKM